MAAAGRIILSPKTHAQLKSSLAEDAGRGDITSRLLINPHVRGRAKILAKDKGIFCGGPVLKALARMVDPGMKLMAQAAEGERLQKGARVASLAGRVRSILTFERTALNFIGHLSGIATKTARYVQAVEKYGVRILDTRKTTPLWRELEKYAVRTGGGKNHRMGLYDAVFVKENHRKFGTLARLARFRKNFEIEVRSLEELRTAMALQPKVILFDNFTPARLKRAVRIARGEAPDVILEASGGMTIANVRAFAACGVDWISVGELTHSVTNLDFSLLVL